MRTKPEIQAQIQHAYNVQRRYNNLNSQQREQPDGQALAAELNDLCPQIETALAANGQRMDWWTWQVRAAR